LLPGTEKLIVACPLPAVALPMIGAPGAPMGITLFEGPDAAPVPMVLVAVTVNVYAVPLVSPLTVIGLDIPELVIPPRFDVTV
jgi:hypothetical protein